MASLKQIHSARVLVADEAGGCVGEGDAVITNRAGVPVSVRTADCLPILLVDPDRGAVAAIHAGWRGTAAHIVQEAVERMYAEFGSDPAGIHAAIGPGIGVCCYEVGAEVASQFGMEGAARIDLASENLRQLRQAGLLGASIDVLGLCTKCDAARFHSYRRDKESAGRMISYVRISGPL
jgi:YfiH family protein